MYSVITEHIQIDRDQRRVRKDGQEVHLTGLEYGMLDYLSSHANRLCSRQELLDHVWGPRFLYDPGTIDVHLNALRRKMGWSKNRPVETIRGVGLILRIEQSVRHYTIDLQTFLTDWLRCHEVEISAAGLVAQQHLTPFINELTIEPDALEAVIPRNAAMTVTVVLFAHLFNFGSDIFHVANLFLVSLQLSSYICVY